MTKIKFADDSKVNEYANGSLHFINNGDPIEVSEILAMDLLTEKVNDVNIFEKVSEDVVDTDGGNAGMVTTAPVEENRSNGNTDVGISVDSDKIDEITDNSDISDNSDKTEENKADENVSKTSSRKNR